MPLQSVLHTAVMPALRLLPQGMDTAGARVMLLAIGLQESGLRYRFQLVSGKPGQKGPARGLWQFERGTSASLGGVWGVWMHPASRRWLRQLCPERRVKMDPGVIHETLERDDVLAAGVARLLLWTDPQALPSIDDEPQAWSLYLRTWRPGAYARGDQAQRASLRQKWREYHAQAAALVGEATS